VAEADRRREFTVSEKSRADFVTEVDVAAERAVTAVLRARTPGFAILAEEGEGRGTTGEWRWVIDPLDGTTNFIRGIPFFAVAVGLERNGEPVAGAIVDPTRGTEWHGASGEGAWRGDVRLRVSARTRLGDAIALTGIPFRDLTPLQPYLQGLERVARGTAGIRRMGSAALDLAYVAAGRVDGFWERGLNSWDLAAGLILVREAGGMAGPLLEGGDPLAGGGVVAGNANVFEPLTRLLRAA
jgi:myo-inositol-1(or 4)-monophosphatase